MHGSPMFLQKTASPTKQADINAQTASRARCTTAIRNVRSRLKYSMDVRIPPLLHLSISPHYLAAKAREAQHVPKTYRYAHHVVFSIVAHDGSREPPNMAIVDRTWRIYRDRIGLAQPRIDRFNAFSDTKPFVT